MNDGLSSVLAKIGDVKKSGSSWMARCPAHPDAKNSGADGYSLSISEGDQQPVVLHCHAGCQPEDILKAVGLSWAEVSVDRPKPETKGEIVATYDYVDEAGDLLYQVVRKSPKTFLQRRPDGQGGWSWKLGNTRRPLFQLPQVLAAVAAGGPIFVVEGEKDAQAIGREGFVATCNSGGAGKWLPEHTDTLAGAEVVVISDRDMPGRRHAAAVAKALEAVGANVRCAEPVAGKDVADHLALGHTIEEFTLIEDGWASALAADGDPGPSEPFTDEYSDFFELDESLQPVDLTSVLDGSSLQPMPEQLTRDDGDSLLYAGYVNGIHGDSGTGKGWVICHLIVQNARRGRRTMLLDLEDTAESITARLLALGMVAYDILNYLVYVRPQVQFGPAAVEHLCRLVQERNIQAVVIDSTGEAFGLEGLNEDKDVEVGPWLRRVTRPLADTGAVVVLVDHSTKSADNPLHPSGSKRKRAAITGASYLVESVDAFVKGRGGRLRLTCAKDRHGNFRRGEQVADLVMSAGDTKIRLDLYAPMIRDEREVGVEIILAARAAVSAAKTEGRPLSRSALEGLMKMKAKTDTKRGGIDLAVARGALQEMDGPRNARLYNWVEDMTDGGAGGGSSSPEPPEPAPDDRLFEGAA